jgi:hypothetical protein
MRCLALIILVAAAVCVFYFWKEQAPAPVVAKDRPPAEQFEALLRSGSVDAAQLAAFCTANPQLANKLLRGKQISIRGTVSSIMISGMQGRRADVTLNGSSQRKIVLICDLDQYSGPGVNFRYLGNFQVVGTELLYLVERRGRLTKKVVTTHGATVSQYCSLRTLGGTRVEFQMVNGPQWAKAEINKR